MHFVLFCEFAPRASTCREDPIEWHLVFPSSPSRVPFGRDASLSVGTEGLSRAMLFLGGRNFVLVGLLMGSSSEASVSWGSDVDQLVVDSKLLVPINIVTGSVRLDPAARYLCWGKTMDFLCEPRLERGFRCPGHSAHQGVGRLRTHPFWALVLLGRRGVTVEPVGGPFSEPRP